MDLHCSLAAAVCPSLASAYRPKAVLYTSDAVLQSSHIIQGGSTIVAFHFRLVCFSLLCWSREMAYAVQFNASAKDILLLLQATEAMTPASPHQRPLKFCAIQWGADRSIRATLLQKSGCHRRAQERHACLTERHTGSCIGPFRPTGRGCHSSLCRLPSGSHRRAAGPALPCCSSAQSTPQLAHRLPSRAAIAPQLVLPAP